MTEVEMGTPMYEEPYISWYKWITKWWGVRSRGKSVWAGKQGQFMEHLFYQMLARRLWLGRWWQIDFTLCRLLCNSLASPIAWVQRAVYGEIWWYFFR